MYLYGICITDIEIDYTKVDTFLRSLIDTPARDIVEEYINAMTHLGWDEPNTDFYKETFYTVCIIGCLEHYESNGHFGLYAILRDIIAKNEGIDICCAERYEHQYLGVPGNAPRNEVDGILTKYIKPFTYDGLEIKYHKIS